MPPTNCGRHFDPYSQATSFPSVGERLQRALTAIAELLTPLYRCHRRFLMSKPFGTSLKALANLTRRRAYKQDG